VANQLVLQNDAGNGAAGAIALGSSATASNSQCTIGGSGFTVSGSGNQLSVTIPILLSSSYTGGKGIYGFALDKGSANTGWQVLGYWNNTGFAAPTADSVSPNSGTGITQTFTFKYSSAAGFSFLSSVFGQVNTSTAGTGSCYFRYDPSSNALYLYSDAGVSPSTGITPGSSGTVSNSQCAVSGTGLSASGTGNQITLTVPITFNSSFNGSKNIYGYALDSGMGASGWQTLGTYSVNSLIGTPPTADSVLPISGIGTSQTFIFSYSSVSGASYLSKVYGQFGTNTNGVSACYIQYDAVANIVYLEADNGTAYAGSIAPGSTSTVSNSQCTIGGSAFSVTASGNKLLLTMPVSFSSSFVGTKNIYGYALDKGGLNSGWQTLGTWTNNGIINQPPTIDAVSPSAGTGYTQTFTFKYSSVNGAGYLSKVFGQINTNTAGVGSCYFEFDAVSNVLYLDNDAGTSYSGGLVSGSNTTVSNGQCSIAGAGFTVSAAGNQLTLNIPVVFTSAFAGSKTIYGFALDKGGFTAGWQVLGSWAVGTPVAVVPTADSVTPAGGTATSQKFTFRYSSVNGYSYLSRVYGQVNTSTAGSSSCYFYFDLGSNLLFLQNDGGTGYVGSLSPGASATINNSQCSISGAGLTTVGSGKQFSLSLTATFTGTFQGSKTLYGFAADKGGLTSGWQILGSWTVGTPVSVAPTADSVSPSAGTGMSQTFTFKYSSQNGASYLSRMYGQVATNVTGIGSCYFAYDNNSGTLILTNDAGTAVAGSIAAGSSSTVSNSQCTLGGSGYLVTSFGSQVTITLPVTFTAAYSGVRTLYGYAADQGGLNSGWQNLGSWNINTPVATPPTADSVSPSSGFGTSQSFTFKYSSVNGYSYLNRVYGLVNTSTSGASACYLQYDLVANVLYLESDSGTAFVGGLTPGAGTTLTNSQCSINGSGVAVSGSGNQLTLIVPVSFSGTFSSLKNIYGYASDKAGLNSGWQTLGSWNAGALIVAPPTADSVTPSAGTGTSQVFTFKFSSVNGYNYVSRFYGEVNISTSGVSSCYFEYDPVANALYLHNDAGSAFAGSIGPGGSGSVSNGQCTINGSGLSVTNSGNQTTLSIPLTFTPSFGGPKNVYGYTVDRSGLSSGWQLLGTWNTAAVTAIAPTADSVSPSAGTGTSQLFSFKFSSANGYTYLARLFGQINSNTSGIGSCYFQYDPAANLLYLDTDSGTAFAGSVVPGSSGSVSNSQCSISGSALTVTGSGNQITLSVPVTFASGFSSLKNVYGYAVDKGGLNSGWGLLGSWNTGSPSVVAPTADSVSPNVATGNTQTLTFKYSSANGYSYLTRVYGQIGTGTGASGGCYFVYDATAAVLYLENDGGTGYAGSLALGSALNVTNSQCTIQGSGFTVSGAGNQLSVTVPIIFTSSYVGAKAVYGYAADKGGLNSGWQTLGTDLANVSPIAPTADSVVPASGTTVAQTFSFSFSSVNGYLYLRRLYGQINTNTGGVNSCYFQYDTLSRTLYLDNDAGTGFVGSLTLGSTATLSNSQCTIGGGTFSVTGSGNQLVLNVPVVFAASYVGAKNIYGFASDNAGLSSGWQILGSWTSTGILNLPPTADSVSPASGSGGTQSFTFKFSSVNGYSYLSHVYGQIGSNTGGVGACYFQYDTVANILYLDNDNGTAYAGSLSSGSSTVISNSQCSISGSGFTVSGGGAQLTVTVPVTFSAGFVGSKNVYGFALDKGGFSSGWQVLGGWIH